MLLDVIKALMYIFPFIKELFLGKKDKDGKPISVPQSKGLILLKQALILLAIFSVGLNFVLTQRLYTMGSLVVSLKKVINANQNKDSAETAPAPKDYIGNDPPANPPPPQPRQPESLPPREQKPSVNPARPAQGSKKVIDPEVDPTPNDRHYQRLRQLNDIR